MASALAGRVLRPDIKLALDIKAPENVPEKVPKKVSKDEKPEKSRVVTAKVTVSVAQLVEPRIVIPVVVGSSPIVHPSFLRRFFVRAVSSVGRAADS